MCRFLSWDFDLDVVACDAVSEVEKLPCKKTCRDALENGDFWRESDAGLPA